MCIRDSCRYVRIAPSIIYQVRNTTTNSSTIGALLIVLLVNGTWKRELFSMTVDKRWKIGSWWVVRRLIKLLMVIETRPVDPGSTQGSHRPISFIREKYRTRADDICVKLSINNHIVGLVNRNHSYYTNASDVRRSLQSWVSTINGCTHSWRFSTFNRVFAKVRFKKITSSKIVPKAIFAVHFLKKGKNLEDWTYVNMVFVERAWMQIQRAEQSR